ncbi:N-acetyltransferase [Thalassotalea euphylliae]|uniref:N-acetyltransferase n=1 Tax=Thalassotalea euphylliae TaxID=1655234 RepID=A0A3E0TPB9_9GAMM|nr:GNAT family N-acetyltransferase [Thalassotalea euphylliae]REL25922.1 N-acetyltransferase [Thalassotalea euphylliae]
MIQALQSIHQLSEQLKLKPLVIEDAQALFAEISESRAQLAKYLYWVDGVTDVVSTECYIDERINSGLPSATWFTIINGERVCGVFGIKYIDGDKHLAEVGYWLGTNAQGRGVISQIITYIKAFLKQHQVRDLVIACLAQNNVSIRVAEKAGGKLVSVEPKAMVIDGQAQALLTYQISLSA